VQPAYKVCPDCGVEFLITVSHCSDCGTLLVSPSHLPAAPAPLAAGPDLIPLRRIEPYAASEIADALQAAGIPCRVEVAESDRRDDAHLRRRQAAWVDTFVRRADYTDACEVDAEVMARRAPEYAEREIGEELDANACPGCAAPLEPRAASCAACGLVFPV
jgi:hypothetical protein